MSRRWQNSKKDTGISFMGHSVEIEFITKHWLRGEMFCRVRHPQ